MAVSVRQKPRALSRCEDVEHNRSTVRKRVRFSPDTKFGDETDAEPLPRTVDLERRSVVPMLHTVLYRATIPFAFWRIRTGGATKDQGHLLKPIDQVHSDMQECVELMSRTRCFSATQRRALKKRFAGAWKTHYRELALFLLDYQFTAHCTGKLLIKPMVEEIMPTTPSSPLPTVPDRLATLRDDHEKLHLLLRLTV